jgi:hypothetical protein
VVNPTLMRIVLVACLLGCSGSALAQGYLGAGVGLSLYDYEDVDDSTGYKFFGGFRPQGGLVGFEVAYFDAGEADISSLPGLSLNIDGFYGAATFNFDSGDWHTFLKAGLYSFDTELKGPGGSITEDSTGFHWGLGFAFAMPQSLGVRFEIEGFEGVEDFADDGSLLTLGVGLQYNF